MVHPAKGKVFNVARKSKDQKAYDRAVDTHDYEGALRLVEERGLPSELADEARIKHSFYEELTQSPTAVDRDAHQLGVLVQAFRANRDLEHIRSSGLRVTSYFVASQLAQEAGDTEAAISIARLADNLADLALTRIGHVAATQPNKVPYVDMAASSISDERQSIRLRYYAAMSYFVLGTAKDAKAASPNLPTDLLEILDKAEQLRGDVSQEAVQTALRSYDAEDRLHVLGLASLANEEYDDVLEALRDLGSNHKFYLYYHSQFAHAAGLSGHPEEGWKILQTIEDDAARARYSALYLLMVPLNNGSICGRFLHDLAIFTESAKRRLNVMHDWRDVQNYLSLWALSEFFSGGSVKFVELYGAIPDSNLKQTLTRNLIDAFYQIHLTTGQTHEMDQSDLGVDSYDVVSPDQASYPPIAAAAMKQSQVAPIQDRSIWRSVPLRVRLVLIALSVMLLISLVVSVATEIG